MLSFSRFHSRRSGNPNEDAGGGSTPTPSTIPMSWDHSLFSTNTAGSTATVTGNTTYTNKTWDDSPAYNTPSNSDSTAPFPWVPNNNTTFNISKSRWKWREGFRVADAGQHTGVTLNMSECYFDCVGRDMQAFGATRPDHSDCFQTYAPNNSSGTLNISKTCFRAYTYAEATSTFGSNYLGSVGLLWGDEYSGTLNLTDVVFLGGHTGIELYAGRGTTTISFENVYFIPTVTPAWTGLKCYLETYTKDGFTGAINIVKWTNVRDATLDSNGNIVPGALISIPTGPGITNSTGTGTPANPGTFNAQTGTFTIEWDAIPSASPIDVVTGLSNGVPTAFSSYACTIIFASDGLIKSRSGGSVAAANSRTYTGGVSYHCRMVVDVAAKTYNSYVTPAGGSEVQIANIYGFRTEQNAVPQLNYLSRMSTTGDVTMTNMIQPPAETLAPVVANQTMPELLTTGSGWVAGKVVGTVTASRSPTSFAFSPTNVNLSISNGGVITVTSSGITAYGNTAGNLTVGVTASNVNGTSPAGTITIPRVQSSSALAIPKSMTDPMFTSMVEQNSRLNAVSGTTYNNYSWLDDTTNINQSVIAANNTTWNKVRMRTCEGWRFGGATNVVINQMYMEITDTRPDAHADGIQWYHDGTAPPGPGSYPNISRAINGLTIRNSHIRGLDGCYTLALIADWSCGTITFENCLFTSNKTGCQGFVFNPQTSTLPDTITVSVKDCYVEANAWGNGSGVLNGNDCFKINTTSQAAWYIHPCTVSLWQNVNYCTWNHSTGVLTPGSAFPQPSGT